MKARVTPDFVTALSSNEVFVFGSNLVRRAKAVAGAARVARRWGSGPSHAEGPEGQTYALPTVDDHMRPLSVDRIKVHVTRFVEYARTKPEQVFLVTAVGTGLAGHRIADIAVLFGDASKENNIHLPESFWKVLEQRQEKSS